MTNIIFMTIILKNWLLKMALHFSGFEIHSVALCGCVLWCPGKPRMLCGQNVPKNTFLVGKQVYKSSKIKFFLHLYPVMCRFRRRAI